MKKIILLFVIAFVLVCQISTGAEESSEINTTAVNVSDVATQLFTINATSGQHGNITPSGSIGVEEGETVTFTITPDPGQVNCWGGGTRYVVWNITVDGQVIEGEPSLKPVNYTFSDVIANHSIHAEFTEMIIDARPFARFEADETFGFAPFTTHFSQIFVSNHTRLQWSFGDNSTSSEENPNHTYSLPGSYNVSLTIWCDEDEFFTEEKENYISVLSSLPPIGGSKGYFMVHSNIDGAQVFFDNDFKGNISNGTLNVSVFITGAPYRNYTLKLNGFNDVKASIKVRPRKGETVDLYAILIPSTFYNFDNDFIPFPSVGIPYSEFKDFNFAFIKINQTPNATPVVVNMTNNGKTIPVALGDKIEVELDENPSTGFSWNATTTPGLAIITDRFEPSDTSGGRPGAGGIHIWELQTTQSGLQNFSAIYKQSWMPASPEDTKYVIYVQVASVPGPVYTERENNKTIPMKDGDIFTVFLPENPTTGASWNMSASSGIRITADKYFTNSTPRSTIEGGIIPIIAGRGGLHEWNFEVIESGEQKIEGIYMQPWMPVTGDEKTFTMTIQVPPQEIKIIIL